MARNIEYDNDSDADDEFERSTVTSIVLPDSDGRSDGEHSPLETPKTFMYESGQNGERTVFHNIITEWTADECGSFVSSLKLGQYKEAFLENAIVGEALVAITHAELREMGVNSVGHRLTILKNVYDVKKMQGVPIEIDDYVPPSAEGAVNNQKATQDDISRLLSTIQKRDERISATEADMKRLQERYDRLREDLLPLFRWAKENNEALPSPSFQPPVKEVPGLARKPSRKAAPGWPTAAKPQSPTFQKYNGTDNSLQEAPSNQTNQGQTAMSPGYQQTTHPESPRYAPLQPNNASRYTREPELPVQRIREPERSVPSTGRSYQTYTSSTTEDPHSSYSNLSNMTADTSRSLRDPPSSNNMYTPSIPSSRNQRSDDSPIQPPSAGLPPPLTRGVTQSSIATLATQQQLQPSLQPPSQTPQRDRDRERERDRERDRGDASFDIYKKFRVSMDDPCYKVLPAALKKYNIQADWRQYALYIVYGDQERCLGLEEKPLILFKQLDRENKKPMFMLRKHAAPMEGHLTQINSGITTGVDGLPYRPNQSTIQLPGGVL